MSKLTRQPRFSKPSPDFPLFPHATGRWAKKIKGRFHYFGKVADDPKGEKALAQWLDERDDLLAGRTPRVKADGFALRELLDRYVVAKRHLLDTHEISPGTSRNCTPMSSNRRRLWAPSPCGRSCRRRF